MMPLNDSEPNRYTRWPVMTLALIAANTLVLVLVQLWLYDQDEATALQFFYAFGSVPHLVLARLGGGALASLTSTFLHSGLLHLGGNMLALWVFGRRVEDACGPWRFLLFYLTCGLGADVLTTFVLGDRQVFSIGASGAVYGVMGAYLLLYPGGRIRTLVLLTGIPTVPQIRAIWVVLFFVATQLVPAFAVLASGGAQTGGVGYWAHLGGFFCCLLIFLYLRPEALQRYVNDTPD